MQRSVEICTDVTGRTGGGEGFHYLRWRSKVELTLDCFICERTARTTLLEVGAERAVCGGSRGGAASHYTAARISAFDVTSGADQLALRTVVSFWWAPFTDAASGHRAAAPTLHPWVRLHLGYDCPQEGGASGSFGIRTNMERPVSEPCAHCSRPVATSTRTPTIRLLD
ncbi:hypothetical protein QIS99_03045 [Streptomyces sp. B-S-A8]|uniref:Uncharacterized protein n=1 Tax=Streptomyces solicavernae TaxID=3043614 RepID=A0ABT6RL92_9ACTN|nr:hypothetical protein [Streptomyces sp. B-S-A8]MDI3385199.1 hypothetical protein [Streptomyces sp. B-S-A8]